MTIKTQDKYGLRERAILVKVNTSLFGTQKKDNEATARAANDHGAAVDQVAFTKSIINRKNPLFKAIDKIKGSARNFHLAHSGPWDDNFRVISTTRYTQWREVLDGLIVDFDKAVDEFIKALPDIKAEARQNLGALYEEGLFPSDDAIRESFAITLETEVLPDRTNTILDLDQARTDQIIADATAADAKRVQGVTDHAHEVVRKELDGLITALRTFGDELPDTKRTKTFRDSLTKNIAGLADILPGLNITGDPKLDKLAQEIAAKLTVKTAAELRGDARKGDNRTKEAIEAEAATAREKVADDAEELLNDLSGIFGDAA